MDENTNSHGLQLDYADFISSYPWDIYSTITFKQRRKDSIYWAGRIYRVLEKFGATRAFVACEPHRLDGIHYHTLSRHLPPPDYLSSLWKYCFKAFGRSVIEWVDTPLVVSRYCAKYVIKGNQFDFMGAPEAWLQDDNSYAIDKF